MSVAVGAAFSASKDAPTVHSNKKAEDQKNGEVEKLCCEFDKKTEDLSKEFSKETGNCKDDCVKCEQPETDKVFTLLFHFRIMHSLGQKLNVTKLLASK